MTTVVDVPKGRSDSVRSRVGSRGADVVLVTVRELRLLLGLLLVLFVTSEVWRYIGRLNTFRLALLLVMTLAAALLVIALGLRRTIEQSAVRRATVRVTFEVMTFGATLFGMFVVVGVASIDAELAAEWSGSQADILVSLGMGRPPLVMTRELLQVAAFLAAFGTLVFAVEVIADSSTRHTLVRDLIESADRSGAADDPAEPVTSPAGDSSVIDPG